MKKRFLLLCCSFLILVARGEEKVPIWDRFELQLVSETVYQNALYDVKEIYALFTAPSGRTQRINGFWDGEKDWKIRLMPDENGIWTYHTFCSDTANAGLHDVSGRFVCSENENQHSIYQHGRISRERGNYHLNHEDGTPFFWLGCTAWNGGLKSTPESGNITSPTGQNMGIM